MSLPETSARMHLRAAVVHCWSTNSSRRRYAVMTRLMVGIGTGEKRRIGFDDLHTGTFTRGRHLADSRWKRRAA